MNLSEALQWLEHFIVTEIRFPGLRQRAMLALDAVKRYVSETKETVNDRPQRLDARKGRR